MTPQQITQQLKNGQITLHLTAHQTHQIFKTPLKQLPYDEYYIAKAHCTNCNNTEYAAWPANKKQTNKPLPCHHCKQKTLHPIPNT